MMKTNEKLTYEKSQKKYNKSWRQLMKSFEMKKQQHNVNREAEKATLLSLGKIDQYEYLTDE